jgi:hypothetical protein
MDDVNLWFLPVSFMDLSCPSLHLSDDHSHIISFQLDYKEILSSQSQKYVEGALPSL